MFSSGMLSDPNSIGGVTHIDGIMGSMLASSVADRGFKPGQIKSKAINFGIYWSVKHVACIQKYIKTG